MSWDPVDSIHHASIEKKEAFPILRVKRIRHFCLNAAVKNAQVLLFAWQFLGGGFKYVLFSPLVREDSHFDYSNIFQMGSNHQPGFLGVCMCFFSSATPWWHLLLASNYLVHKKAFIDLYLTWLFRCTHGSLLTKPSGHVAEKLPMSVVSVISPRVNRRKKVVKKEQNRRWFQIIFFFHPNNWGNDPIWLMTNISELAWFNHQLDKRLVPYSGDLDAPKAWSEAWSFRSGSLPRAHGGCCGCRGIGIWKTLGWIPWEIGWPIRCWFNPLGIGFRPVGIVFKSLDVRGCLPISTGYSNANWS